MILNGKLSSNMRRYTVCGSGPDCKSGVSQFTWFDSKTAHQSYCRYNDNNSTFIRVGGRRIKNTMITAPYMAP